MRALDVRAVLGISRWELAKLILARELPWPVTEQALEEYVARHLPGREPVTP
jgi:hypothetical protein